MTLELPDGSSLSLSPVTSRWKAPGTDGQIMSTGVRQVPASELVTDAVLPGPEFTPREHAALKASIAAHGVPEPVEAVMIGSRLTVTDGNNRASIAAELGLVIPVAVTELSPPAQQAAAAALRAEHGVAVVLRDIARAARGLPAPGRPAGLTPPARMGNPVATPQERALAVLAAAPPLPASWPPGWPGRPRPMARS